MTGPEILLVFPRDEVHLPIPFKQQGSIFLQETQLLACQVETVDLADLFKREYMFHVERYLIRLIIKIETSAGVTPLMRMAWPMDRGFIRLSFSLPSLLSDFTPA